MACRLSLRMQGCSTLRLDTTGQAAQAKLQLALCVADLPASGPSPGGTVLAARLRPQATACGPAAATPAWSGTGARLWPDPRICSAYSRRLASARTTGSVALVGGGAAPGREVAPGPEAGAAGSMPPASGACIPSTGPVPEQLGHKQQAACGRTPMPGPEGVSAGEHAALCAVCMTVSVEVWR